MMSTDTCAIFPLSSNQPVVLLLLFMSVFAFRSIKLMNTTHLGWRRDHKKNGIPIQNLYSFDSKGIIQFHPSHTFSCLLFASLSL